MVQTSLVQVVCVGGAGCRGGGGGGVTSRTSYKGEESFLQDVEHCGQEERQRQEDEQLVSQLPTVVLGDEFPPELNGSRHGLELFIGLLDSPGGGGYRQEEERGAVSPRGGGEGACVILCHLKTTVLV